MESLKETVIGKLLGQREFVLREILRGNKGYELQMMPHLIRIDEIIEKWRNHKEGEPEPARNADNK